MFGHVPSPLHVRVTNESSRYVQYDPLFLRLSVESYGILLYKINVWWHFLENKCHLTNLHKKCKTRYSGALRTSVTDVKYNP